MSHTLYEANAQRVHRCELAVPGSSPEMFEKALKSGVDVIFLDLEDAVAPDDKLQARKNVIKAINELDWAGHGITVSIRINGLDTQYMVRDVVDLVEQCGDKIDTILIPKVGVYSDVYMVEAMLNQLEMQQGMTKKIGIECLIETALGMANVEDIAKQGALGGRLEALHFGVADYAASNRARTTNIGGLNPDYPGDQWHFAISRMTVACRAYGLRAIDGPFGDIKDPEGFKDAARRAAALGCEGKWAIHPSQIALANEVFTPPVTEVEKAKRILQALKEAAAQGKGAAALDGRLIDAASEKMANNVVKTAEAIAAKA
ncbi:HpcH/HpaI aldolase/citrate lyase family protein [methanotrophic endosymbiont of Bathymodiolus puteoserpentis (Logatchev)]|jgi:citrate lyase subunit beta/citryl-CoA lyase|uniref:HpcH/HpaI aldolase/citrate lyase family protein n=1 Tax=methanotrophic endosymbiont of Bathymodiolus puteoserpentis (Logatchev) TaxID=343235 RepID=UPI00086D7365|nr:CoA ester lyase [methanotrophic endosymbiont of Bathymodiolus puteoserpentis (Logatchev)]SCN47874.1 Malyl-CoA lyase [methanotrophic endosymbiont of Bathymodiolus azoricus (Menez Gwen)]SHE20395.1 Malyl-CoA lyase [methanotrophic endosymbiont of Bathymodiolus puteoserpentis (Logatchev)]